MDEGKDLDRIALIDVCAEDDLLISSTAGRRESSGDNKGCGLLVEEPARSRIQVEHVPVPSDSPEVKHNCSSKYNLRKSLAWDSAFFTSEGVLDPEELAIVSSTFKKVQIHVLPGIEEDARKSGESTTTLDSDSWAAENTDVDLFENLRASIQNFQAQCRNPLLLHSSSTLKPRKLDGTDIGNKTDTTSCSASKNAQTSSRAKIKPPFAPKKHDSSGQQLVGKSNGSASHQQVSKTAGGSREEKPSLRPPRTASGLQIAPSRGTSTSRSINVKSKNEGVLLGDSKPTTASRKHLAGDHCNATTPRSSPSVKSSGPAKLRATAACSSNGGPGGSSCARIGKAPLESLRKKTSATKFDQSSSKSAKVYSVRASKDISGTRSGNITLKLSSSISPSSSIESFASASSSSSTSTARKPTSSRGTLDYSSSPRLGFAAYDAPHDISGAKSLKPSGLRLPSPKIGYFDAEKSLTRCANKGSQRCSQVTLIRNTSKLNTSGGSVQQPKSSEDLCEKCPNTQDSSTKNISLKANNVGMETPRACQLSTPSIEEDKCLEQCQTEGTYVTGDEPVVHGEGAHEARDTDGKVLGHSSSIPHENKWHTISLDDKENMLLPSEALVCVTNHA